MNIDMKLESAHGSLRTAQGWEERREWAWVDKCLSSAMFDYLSIAVEQFDAPEKATEWLCKQRVLSIVSRHQKALEKLVERIDAGEMPASVIAGNYPHLVFTHLNWALGSFDQAEFYARVAARPDVMELSTPFWQEYAIAIAALVEDSPYTLGELVVTGQEKYWHFYLHLIESATKNENLSVALDNIGRAFVERNSDNSIKDDAYEIEGSGDHPIQWDFRRDSLIKYIQAN